MITVPAVLIATHDQAVHAIRARMKLLSPADWSRPLGLAVTRVLDMHVAEPSETGKPDPDCEFCDGVGTVPSLDPATAAHREAHCHCRCPWCKSCEQPLCEGPCETVREIAVALGVVLA